MQFRLRLFLLLTLVFAFAACAPARRGAAPAQPRTTIEVDNRNFLDMRIYVMRGPSQRVRLGTVTGLSTQTLVIPSNLIFGATPLRFQADPIGGQARSVSHEITVSPGDEVRMIIPPS